MPLVLSTLCVAASVALGQLESPASHALPLSVAFVGWGAVVACGLGITHTSWAPGSAAPSRGPHEGRLRWAPLLVVLAALAVRLPLLRWPAELSDDVFRYVWEGNVWRSHFSPFAHAPDDEALRPLRDATWAQVNHRSVSSIYPPVAQGWFWLLSPFGPLGFRVAATAADALTAGLLWRHRESAGWAWALLPLPVIESAANGHLEALGCLLVVLALSGSRLAALGAALVKFLPAVLLAREPPRRLLAWAALAALTFIPLAGPGLLRGLATYEEHWSFNGSAWPLLAWLLDDGVLARRVLLVLGAAVVARAVWTERSPARRLLITAGAFVLLSPTVHPWYALWALLPALWLGSRAFVVLAVLAPLAYVVLGSESMHGTWHESTLTRVVIWVPVYVVLVVDAWRGAFRAGPGGYSKQP